MCGGCFLIFLASTMPRLGLIYIFLFTHLIKESFSNMILPILGFIFLPFTTLAYVLVYDGVSITPWGWFFLIFAFLVDSGSYSAGVYKKKFK
jgi:hypothetical protein